MDSTRTTADPPPPSTTTDEPTFSVIIPTYRRPELLAEAVASVLAQTRSDWECVVVDDGGGLAIDPPDPRVRVLTRPRAGGPAAARNTGVAAARGRWLTFLDDDDRYTPRRLELAAAGLARAPVAICWTRWFESDPATGGSAGPEPAKGRWLVGDVSDTILDSTTPHLGATAVAATAMVPFDVRFRAVEDVEWWLRMAERCPVDTIAEVGCEIRRHRGVRANRTDVGSRQGPNQLLLDDRPMWFASHPRARAFRWSRMGAMAVSAGDTSAARDAYRTSMVAWPTVAAARGLLQVFRPRRGPFGG
jgi:glycosyltransferase involved in cell wall biosynthesis